MKTSISIDMVFILLPHLLQCVCVFCLYLHQSVSRPDVCSLSSCAGVHRTHKLSALFLIAVQVEAVAVLPLHQVTQTGNVLLCRLR